MTRGLWLVISTVLLLALPGCFEKREAPTPVVQQVPEIQMPQRPALDKMTPDELAEYRKLPAPVQAKLEGNNEKLQMYARQLEVSVIEYNGYARYTNQKSAKWLRDGADKLPPEKKGP